MVSMFGKWILHFFIFITFSSCAYAEMRPQIPQVYGALTAGYGKFQDAAQGTGETTVERIAAGTLWHLNQNLLLGGEVGIQSGNRMQLSNNVAAAFGYTFAMPIYLTVKPPADLLVVLKYHFGFPIFVHVKAGVVYLRTMTDTTSIPSKSRWLPEVQIGAGLDLTCHTRLVLSYQQFFGQSPSLTNINAALGTATLKHVPTWHAGLISFEFDF